MMKTIILMLIPLALVMGQQKKTTKKRPAAAAPQDSTATQPASPTAPAAAPVPALAPPPSSNAEQATIPAGAKEVEPFLFAYTDAGGKRWFYRRTPFGVVKWEDKPITTPPMADNTNPVIITDLGDSVRFLWKTPFGDQSWVRKKTELNDDEKAMMAREQNKRPAPDPMAGGKQTGSTAKAPEKQ